MPNESAVRCLCRNADMPQRPFCKLNFGVADDLGVERRN